MNDKPVSDYLNRPLRDLCPACKERPAKRETEVCERCELEAQANVVDLGQERAFRHVLKIMGGEG